MNFSFLSPTLLLLLLPVIPFIFWISRRSLAGLPSPSRVISLFLRTVIVLCLILALSEVQIVATSRSHQVYFVVDRSKSIPEDLRVASLTQIRRMTRFMTEKDQAGIVVFGENGGIEATLRKELNVTSVKAVIKETRTSIERGLQLAVDSFLPGGSRRIVLLSDGNENLGSARSQVQRAIGEGIQIDVLPLRYEYDPEVYVDKLIAPRRSRKGEPFDVRAVLHSSGVSQATVNLYQDNTLVAREQVDLKDGPNVLTLSRNLPETGFHKFDVVIESQHDTLPRNNKATTFTSVSGEPHILFVTESDSPTPPFLAQCQQEGIRVHSVSPADLPKSATALENYQAVVLSNVPAASLSTRQMEAVEAFVGSLGRGLVVLGGDESYAAGGYQGTALEEALPVTMDIPQKKVLPNGALVIVLHTCEFPDGNVWAKQITKAALDVLSVRDLFGVVTFDSRGGGDRWGIPLSPATDKASIANIIEGLSPGDMPSFNPSLQIIARDLPGASAALKHVVIISDGDPSRPQPALIKKITDAKITISTVCINPHSGSDTSVMEDLATLGGGTYYFVEAVEELPEIFIREATIIRRSAIMEEPFFPEVGAPSEVLRGVPIGSAPALLGYVITTPRPTAELALLSPSGDPVLALGRHGLGRSVAFTSDATGRWSSNWLPWSGYPKLFTQVIRYAIGTEDSTLNLEVEAKGDRATITFDAVTLDGQILSNLNARATVLTPELESSEVVLRQTEPGRYQAEVPVQGDGSHLVRVTFTEEGSEEVERGLTTGFALSVSPEYQTLRPDEPLLAEIANLGSGSILTGQENVFQERGKPTDAPKDLWPFLLGLSLALVPFDIFFRRVVFDWEKVFAFARSPRKKTLADQEQIEAPTERFSQPEVMKTTTTTTDSSPEKTSTSKETAARSVEPKTAEEDGQETTKRLLAAKRKATRRRSNQQGESE